MNLVDVKFVGAWWAVALIFSASVFIVSIQQYERPWGYVYPAQGLMF